jgi:hypothetical protein
MHAVIPKWKILHRGIQDLISHIEIFPICIRLVTAYRASPKSPYAYGDPFFGNPHMHTGIKVTLRMHMGISGTHTGSNLDPCSGSMRDSRKDRSYVRIWSSYAYGDSSYAYGEEGKKNCTWGLPVCTMKLCAYGDQHVRICGWQRANTREGGISWQLDNTGDDFALHLVKGTHYPPDVIHAKFHPEFGRYTGEKSAGMGNTWNIAFQQLPTHSSANAKKNNNSSRARTTQDILDGESQKQTWCQTDPSALTTRAEHQMNNDPDFPSNQTNDSPDRDHKGQSDSDGEDYWSLFPPPSAGGTWGRGRIATAEDLILWTEFNNNYYDRSGTFIDEATASTTMTINTSNNISKSSMTSNQCHSRTFNNEAATSSTTTNASSHDTNRYNGNTHPSGRIPYQSSINRGSRWAETKALRRFRYQSCQFDCSVHDFMSCTRPSSHDLIAMTNRVLRRSLQNKRHLSIVVTASHLAQAESTAVHQVTASVDALWRNKKYGHAPREKPAHLVCLVMENFNSLSVTLGNSKINALNNLC